ncbi:hypothetical protein ACOMHN_048221 [Nucella lapillus]
MRDGRGPGWSHLSALSSCPHRVTCPPCPRVHTESPVLVSTQSHLSLCPHRVTCPRVHTESPVYPVHVSTQSNLSSCPQ